MNKLDHAKQIASGMTNYLRAKINIHKEETENLQRKRYAVCLSCPKRNEHKDTCLVCGCFLPFKTRSLESSCPENHWEGVVKKNI